MNVVPPAAPPTVLRNLSAKELLVCTGCFLLMGISYWAVLLITSSGTFNGWLQTIVNYGFKLLWLVPVYWIIFVWARDWPLWKRLSLHGLILPLYLYCSVKSFYLFIDTQLPHIGHLKGPENFWDIYIGMLLYLVQLGSLHIYENYRQLQQQKEKEQALERWAHQSEMNALKAQIQPHFLFNTLNSISASVPSHLEHTRELIATLADIFRFALQHVHHDSIPLREELSFIKAYLDLEQERFRDRLEVKFTIEERLLDRRVPPLLLQPIIENAVRHGIAKSIEGGIVEIRIQSVQQHMEVVITDTGIGLRGMDTEKALEKGIGLRNTHLRLTHLFGQGITLTENNPRGVQVSFQIPQMESYA